MRALRVSSMQPPFGGGSQRPWTEATRRDGCASRDEERGAVSGLRGLLGDRRPVRDALARRERGALLDVVDEEVEGTLRVRLDQLQAREDVPERLDVVPVLHLVEAVRGRVVIVVVAGAALVLPASGERGTDLARIGARVVVDGKQTVHRSGDGDERAAD